MLDAGAKVSAAATCQLGTANGALRHGKFLTTEDRHTSRKAVDFEVKGKKMKGQKVKGQKSKGEMSKENPYRSVERKRMICIAVRNMD